MPKKKEKKYSFESIVIKEILKYFKDYNYMHMRDFRDIVLMCEENIKKNNKKTK